jgi:hypothetical protein
MIMSEAKQRIYEVDTLMTQSMALQPKEVSVEKEVGEGEGSRKMPEPACSHETLVRIIQKVQRL